MAKKAKKTAPSEDGEASAPKGAGGIVGFAVLGVAALATSFGVNFLLFGGDDSEKQACMASEHVAEEKHQPAVLAQEDQYYAELPEILITVGSAPATRYLKMNVSIVTHRDGTRAIEDAEPMLIDAFNTYLRVLELDDFEDPAFYAHMKDQLSRRAELVVGGDVANGVLITEFLLR